MDEVYGINILWMKRSVFNMFIFYIVMILCYFLVFVFMSILSIFYKYWIKIWYLVEIIVFINLFINLVLYIWCFFDFRVVVFKILKKNFLRMSNDWGFVFCFEFFFDIVYIVRFEFFKELLLIGNIKYWKVLMKWNFIFV